MKCSSTFKLILFGFLCAFLASSCVKEGPMGLRGEPGEDGTDGTNGVDGNVTCLVCHSGTNMEEKDAQFTMSVHSEGAIAVDYAGGRASCAPCHSHEQFVQTMTVGDVKGDITNPSAWECSTCHGIHKTFEGIDYALRTSDPITAEYDGSVTMDLNGNSNLCGVCHQTRRAGPVDENQYDRNGNLIDAADNGLYAITSTHYGPHHGPQANVLAGMGFVEIEGSQPYPTSDHPHLTMASCTGCHMADFDEDEAQGGHSFIPSVAACNDCHNGPDLDGSYDYKSTQTLIEDKLTELKEILVDLGVIELGEEELYELNEETGEIELVVHVEGYEPVTETFPILHVDAFFNWIGLEEDRSLGVHNPEYVKALLINTIEALEAESN